MSKGEPDCGKFRKHCSTVMNLYPDLLLDLVATVCTSKADDKLQLLRCVVHKLAFQTALLCLRGPGKSLVEVQQAIQ